jgi:hypothetical protein
MLAAHLVPGYLAASLSRPHWEPRWTRAQRSALWAVALGTTVLPDLDVAYNALFAGFFNHSTLWTHSVFVYLALGLLSLVLRRGKRYRYVGALAGLAAVGGLSHLALDIIAHGTPMFYPLSMAWVCLAPQRVVEGGVWAYLTEPVFLLEPVLFAGAVGVAVQRGSLARGVRRRVIAATLCALLLFGVVFVAALPRLQEAVAPLVAVAGG